jgi:MFS family permease
VLLLVPFLLRDATDLPPFAAGCLLAASPLVVMIGSPLAGRLAARVAPRQLALAGAIASTIGLSGLALTQVAPNLPLLALAMLVQGIGMGLFQVGYLDIVTAAVPRADRGVAGSLAMLTRMTGTLAGATLLMLVFQLNTASFHAGFQATLIVAALLAAAASLLLVQRKMR